MAQKRKTDGPKVPEFAAKLKALRMAQNWSLRDVEKRTGRALSRQTVLRAEQGDAELDTVLKLLGLYSVKKDERETLLASYNAFLLKSAKASIKAA